MSSRASHRGLLLVISSPSGAGKSSLSQKLMEMHPELTLSVSATTRAPRAGEVDGVHYHFLSVEEFERRKAADAFYESARVHGNHYGTPKAEISQILERGCDVLLDIDWQGAQQLWAQRDADIVSIFILPPSMAELEARLRKRAQDDEEVIAQRLAGAADEITHWAEYQYVLVNHNFDDAVRDLDAIIKAERLKRSRQNWINDFVAELLGQERRKAH